MTTHPRPTEESVYLARRSLLKAMGVGGVAALSIGCPGQGEPTAAGDEQQDGEAPYGRGSWRPDYEAAGGNALYPAKRNAAFVAQRPVSGEDAAGRHNNFYEFLPGKAGPVHKYIDDFEVRPWQVQIAGEVEKPLTLDVDDIARIAPLEERVYRFRCVERWTMVVPWTGIPMAKFIEHCKPTSDAKYVRFISFNKPDQAPGMKSASQYPWPYYEALRLDEAVHPLALLVTGIYGHGLPVQHGAPLRVIVPWKYGYKSPKSFVRVEFTRTQPHTFWNDVSPKEYGFLSNVDPNKPHPRWSQAKEKDLETGEERPTLLYNGYADEVARLYPS